MGILCYFWKISTNTNILTTLKELFSRELNFAGFNFRKNKFAKFGTNSRKFAKFNSREVRYVVIEIVIFEKTCTERP